MSTPDEQIARELERIAAAYERRRSDRRVPTDRYSAFNAATLLHMHSLERGMLALLKREGITDLSASRILDVGCGSGGQLRRFIDYGAQPANLAGIDLLPERIERARALNPAIAWTLGSGHELPYADASFDLVTSFVLFSSILDEALCRRIAAEMWRVLRPGGVIVCHDFAYNNPRNPAVRGFSPAAVRRVFARPWARFRFRRIVLAPPIARRLAPRAPWLADALERLTLLNTHLIATARLEAGVNG